ncbi:MAG: hypothetical protein JOZ90_16050 [Alphaproteobacteria bacterium]|nr:hypothetical protein [Alphaproteobacteria bacterium]MBV9373372.1 hypothetical protein [Alphaproteobacteria bacterium]MBV9902587.1 hypothetical protein [Alphaproteobacteria bacterium]
MEAPPTRYRVIEKEGRLVVIDTATGEAASRSPAPPPEPGGGFVVTEASWLDRAADFAAARATRGRDAQGRAIVAWEWKRNGRTQRWDAALDSGQQRRLGRALVAMAAAFPIVFLSFVSAHPLIGLLLAAPLVGGGAIALNRLQAETGGR